MEVGTRGRVALRHARQALRGLRVLHCLVLFQQGDVDAITGDDTVLAGLAAQDPYAVVTDAPAVTEEPYGVATNIAAVDLVRFVNQVLEAMRADGRWTAMYNRWLAPTLGTGTGQPTPTYGRG